MSECIRVLYIAYISTFNTNNLTEMYQNSFQAQEHEIND